MLRESCSDVAGLAVATAATLIRRVVVVGLFSVTVRRRHCANINHGVVVVSRTRFLLPRLLLHSKYCCQFLFSGASVFAPCKSFNTHDEHTIRSVGELKGLKAHNVRLHSSAKSIVTRSWLREILIFHCLDPALVVAKFI